MTLIIKDSEISQQTITRLTGKRLVGIYTPDFPKVTHRLEIETQETGHALSDLL